MATAKKTRTKPVAKPTEPVADATKAPEVENPAENTEQAAPTPEFQPMRVTCDGFSGLNIRKTPEKPKTGNNVIGKLLNHAKVNARDAGNGWYELEDGGFVMADYLE